MATKTTTAAKMLGTAKTKEDTKTTKSTAPKTAKAKGTATTDLIITVSSEMEKLTKAKALTMAKKLIEDTEFNNFRIGGIFSVIQAQAFWEGVNNGAGNPYETFKDFMEEEYGMPYRKGMYLLGTYNNLIESGVPWGKVKDVGWTKLKEISSIITVDNVDEWVERCGQLTTIQLIEYIKDLDSGSSGSGDSGPKDAPKTTSMTFKVHPDQKETIQSAVDKAMSEGSTEVAAVALEYVCMGYLEGKVGKVKKVTPSIAEFVKATDLEELLNTIGDLHPEYDITVEPIDANEGD